MSESAKIVRRDLEEAGPSRSTSRSGLPMLRGRSARPERRDSLPTGRRPGPRRPPARRATGGPRDAEALIMMPTARAHRCTRVDGPDAVRDGTPRQADRAGRAVLLASCPARAVGPGARLNGARVRANCVRSVLHQAVPCGRARRPDAVREFVPLEETDAPKRRGCLAQRAAEHVRTRLSSNSSTLLMLTYGSRANSILRSLSHSIRYVGARRRDINCGNSCMTFVLLRARPTVVSPVVTVARSSSLFTPVLDRLRGDDVGRRRGLRGRAAEGPRPLARVRLRRRAVRAPRYLSGRLSTSSPNPSGHHPSGRRHHAVPTCRPRSAPRRRR